MAVHIFYVLLVLLVITRVFGELAERLGQPALVGELIGGVLLGVIVANNAQWFPTLSGLTDNEVFGAITDLGIFFLMVLGGVELKPRDLAESSGRAFVVAIGGLVLPFGLGFGAAWLFLPASELRLAQALFVATALAITAVPVSVKVLMDLGKLDTRAGKVIVSAAVVDDVLSLVMLAVLTGVVQTGGAPSAGELAVLAAKIVAFFAITVVLGGLVFPRVTSWLARARIDELEVSVLLIAAFGYAVLAEALGMHFVIGAFMAGLFFSRRALDPKVYQSVKDTLTGVTTGFLAPVFFASIGLHVSFEAVTAAPMLLIVLLAVAFTGKLVGAGGAARLSGIPSRESVAIGFGMSGRGAVELIIAEIALQAGLFGQPEPVPPVVSSLFSAVVIIAIVTTIATPVALRQVFSRR